MAKNDGTTKMKRTAFYTKSERKARDRDWEKLGRILAMKTAVPEADKSRWALMFGLNLRKAIAASTLAMFFWLTDGK